MRSKLGCFIFLIIMMTSQIFAGTVYYLDATSGNDSNNGTSEASPWRTIARANRQQPFVPGDKILFKRGEIWREQLIVLSSGISGNPIVFGAYGVGNKPIINTSTLITPGTSWTLDSGNVWYATLTTQPYYVWFDNVYGDRKTSKGALANALDWYHDGSTTLYVHSTTEPDTAYTSPGIEAHGEDYTSRTWMNDWIVFDGLHMEKGKEQWSGYDAHNITWQNCTFTEGGNAVMVNDCDNLIFDNMTVYNFYHVSGAGSDGGGLGCNDGDSANFQISNNTIYNCDAYAIGVVDLNTTGGNIYGNTIHDTGLSTSAPEPYAIEGGAANTNIYQNVIYNHGNAVASNSFAISNGDTVRIYQNLIYNCIGRGIDLRWWDNDVYYNIIVNVTEYAISVGGGGTGGHEIYNNVIYSSGSHGIHVNGGAQCANTIIKNNILSENTTYETYVGSSTSGLVIDYNCVYHSGGGNFMNWNGTAYEWTAWKNNSGEDANSLNSDPSFVDAGNANFLLQITSPCIDAGSYVGLTEDFAGNTVPYGWGVDIGAYEYVGENPPLNVSINASPTSGEVPLTVNFTGNATEGTPPYSYSWNFGDGTSSSEQNPSHTYSQVSIYTVNLTVTDNESNQDFDSLTINASAATIPLEASCAASLTSGEVPLTVNFTGDATGGVLPYSYSWDFGDGTSSSEQNPTHTYSQAGDYTATLTVTDSQSNQDSVSITINASDPVVIPLEASFIASPTSGEVPLTVNFTGNATGGVLPYSYSWDFGDGTSSSEQNPIHTYSEAGDYTVSLTVTDSQSNQDSDSLTINASAVSIPPYLSCSPASLYFGSTTPGNESSDQYLRIINAGGGVLTWNIEDDAVWLSCSPSSGTDRGEITVSVNTSGLSLGLYVATITVSSPEAYNSPQYISVNLRVYESEEESSPFGSFDTRLDGSTVSGSVPITGWALDDIETMGVEIKRNSDPEDPPEAIGPDGLVYLGDAVFVEGARPNVENSYPEYPLNSRAGWGYMLLTNSLPNRGNGFFTIYAFAYDAGGHRVEIGRKTIFCDNTNSVKPFGTVDTPEQGESIGGSDYINFGWTLTPLPKTIPKDGSTILLWVDGVQVGEPVYNQYREDIATLYPEYNNAHGAVGYYYLDTTQYENGVHTIAWSVMDDGGEVDGIGVKYFSIDNIETGNVNQERFELKRIYQEDVEGRMIIDMKEFRIGYKPQDDNNIILHLKRESRKGYRLQVEEMEPLRIVLEGSSGGNMNYIGWGESDWRALPIGSTFDPEQGIFSWIPTPGFIGKYKLYFAVTDGSYMSKPLQILVNVMPKSYD